MAETDNDAVLPPVRSRDLGRRRLPGDELGERIAAERASREAAIYRTRHGGAGAWPRRPLQDPSSRARPRSRSKP
jgi:hypothetical protein